MVPDSAHEALPIAPDKNLCAAKAYAENGGNRDDRDDVSRLFRGEAGSEVLEAFPLQLTTTEEETWAE